MLSIQIIACIGLIAGLFFVSGIRLQDVTDGVFANILGKPKGIREEILVETKKKKVSLLKRELLEVREILHLSGKEKQFPLILTACLLLFGMGAAVAAFIGNMFLIPVLAAGFLFFPLWYVKMTAHHYKRLTSQELETALSIITTAYLRSEDMLTAVEESVEYLNPPVQTAFLEFVKGVKVINPDIEKGILRLKDQITNEVFCEWCDAVLSCQHDRSLKTTLTPIVTKLSDMRIVNAELEMMVTEPRKEFLTMILLVIGNVPLLYFLNKDWYHTLMHTLPGQFMLAVTAAIIFISAAHVIKLTKPIEYRR